MAVVKVDVPGIGEVLAENAATESTLRELVQLLGGSTGSTSQQGNPQGEASGPGALGKAAKQAGKNVKSMGNEADTAADKLSKIGHGLGNLVSAIVGTAVSSVTNLGKFAFSAGNSLSDLAGTIPFVGDALAPLTGIIDNQVDMFRQSSSVGANFNNNMFDLNRAAASAATPVGEFAALVGENSAQLKMFGGSVTEGAQRFGRLSKQFRQSTVGMDLMAMGFTTQELNEGLIQFNTIQQMAGRRQRLSDRELREGTGQYLMELDKLTKVTGMSRKEAETAMQQNLNDVRVQMAISDMTTKQGTNFNNNLVAAGNVSDEFKAAMIDMADGVANDPFTRQLMANSDVFKNFAGEIENMSPAEMNKFLMDVGGDIDKLGQGLGKAGVQAALVAGGPLADVLIAGAQTRKLTEAQKETITAEQKKRDALTTSLSQAGETINSLKAKFQEAILGTTGADGPFQKFSDMIAKYIPSFDEANAMYDKLESQFVNDILPSLKGYWENLKEFFTKITTPEGRAEIFDKLIVGIKEWMGGWDWANLASKALLLIGASILTGIGVIPLAIIGGLVALLGWDKIRDFFTGIPDALGETVGGWATSIKEFFVNLWDDTIGYFTNMSGSILDEISSWPGKVFEWAAGLWDSLLVTLNDWYNSLSETITTAFDDIKTFVLSLWDSLTTTISEGFSSIVTGIKDTINGIWDSVKELVTGIFDVDAVKNKMSDMWNGVTTFFSETFNLSFVTDLIKNTWNNIKSGFSNLFNFELKLPNFKSFLPKWLGGEGKSLSGLFSSSSVTSPSSTSSIASNTSDVESTGTEMASSESKQMAIQGAGTDMGTELKALNSNMSQLVELMMASNKINKKGFNDSTGSLVTG